MQIKISPTEDNTDISGVCSHQLTSAPIRRSIGSALWHKLKYAHEKIRNMILLWSLRYKAWIQRETTLLIEHSLSTNSPLGPNMHSTGHVSLHRVQLPAAAQQSFPLPLSFSNVALWFRRLCCWAELQSYIHLHSALSGRHVVLFSFRLVNPNHVLVQTLGGETSPEQTASAGESWGNTGSKTLPNHSRIKHICGPELFSFYMNRLLKVNKS